MTNKFVNIKWQDGPIKKYGKNGVQVDDVLKVVKDHLLVIDEDHPCKENHMTITAIDNAINYQDMRTQDRVKRGVEGTNEK